MLNNAMLKDVAGEMMAHDAKRAAVAPLCDAHEVSQRRACAALKADRSSVQYVRQRGDAGLRAKIWDVAAERRRFGYRHARGLLQRKGVQVNHKRLRRLYAEKKLQPKRRRGRKRALGTRRPMMTIPHCPEPALKP